MARDSIIVGLDIGTQFVRTTMVQLSEEAESLDIIGVGVAPSAGIRRANVVDVDETVKAISSSIEEAERVSGMPVSTAFVNVSGNHIESENSRGVVAVSRADSEIGREDTNRAVEAAKAVAVPPNKEIIHVIPREFIVDGQEGIKDAIGMNGIRLEVEAHVISASTPSIKNLTKCVYQAGIDVDELVYSGLAAGSGVLTKRQRELGAVVIDIGAGVTDVAVYEEGDVLHSAVIPIGGGHISNDIAIGLRTDTDIAERVKLEYAHAIPKEVREKEEIDLASLTHGESQKVSRRLIAEITEARVLEILTLVRKELRKIDRDGKLPAGVVLTGGTSKLPGIVDATKDFLGLPTQVGFPREFGGMVDKVDDPSFATSVGLVVWGMENSESHRTNSLFSNLPGGRYIDKVKSVVKNFLP